MPLLLSVLCVIKSGNIDVDGRLLFLLLLEGLTIVHAFFLSLQLL
jgi:hypothetical protein